MLACLRSGRQPCGGPYSHVNRGLIRYSSIAISVQRLLPLGTVAQGNTRMSVGAAVVDLQEKKETNGRDGLDEVGLRRGLGGRRLR